MSFSKENLAHARKWSKRWDAGQTYRTLPSDAPKYFVTFPFPYVNGAPHVGHAFSCFRADVFARFKRLQGFNVLFPQGFHATGEPIVGAQKRLVSSDETQIRTMKTFGASDEDIERMKSDPQFIVSFWRERWIEDLKLAGMSIDWSRTFTTTDITPAFSRFVSWQYRTLKDLGFIVQDTHPVVWDPSTLSPTGDHDRHEGEGESPQKFSAVLFESELGSLACATLRPETVFGVTNLWIADTSYVRVKVDGAVWIVHRSAVDKLADQLHEVEVLEEVDAHDLVRIEATHPLSGVRLPIFTSSFVEPEHGTGLVMSVPAHAPYDYMALRDLGARGETLLETTENMIALEGVPSGMLNAAWAADAQGVQSIGDRAGLEKATSNVYKLEFHKGRFTIPELEGLSAEKAKERAVAILEEHGAASSLWELTGVVVARSMTRCHVKILENQWFIDYKDAAWKRASHEHLSEMEVYPQAARHQFEHTIGWLEEKACARRSGLGTVLPFDDGWIVETLSDSTVYMAYYTISRFVNDGLIGADDLTDEVFDYLFRAGPKPKDAHRLVDDLKAEFEHFYPVDMRSSGKDLVQNHLTFFVMQHVALFEERFWPRGIAVNGYVSVEGEKMSKSKGNIIPFAQLCEEFGPDLVRANISASADGMDDANWSSQGVSGLASRLDFVASLFERVRDVEPSSDASSLTDRVLIDAVGRASVSVAGHLERFHLRSALQESFFDLTARLRFVLKAPVSDGVLRFALERFVSMNAPFFPYAAAELSERYGFELAWPEPCEGYEHADGIVSFVERVRADLISVRELVERKGGSARTALLFPADDWLYELSARLDEDLSSLMKDEAFRSKGKEAVTAYGQLKKLRPSLPREVEREALVLFKDSLEEDTGLSIEIDPAGERKSGVPEKPGIVIR